mgnify:CR=1 FL=1
MFCRIQNLHISQTCLINKAPTFKFCRIQNLHISQTCAWTITFSISFVEFKIYISLKPQIEIFDSNFAFYKLIFNCIQKNGSTPIQPKGNIDKSLFELDCKF